MISPVVTHWCETWFLILWEKHSTRVFENRVQIIFGTMREETIEK